MTLMEKFLNGINNKIETDLNEVLHEDYKYYFPYKPIFFNVLNPIPLA